jgi:hypothetical protein
MQYLNISANHGSVDKRRFRVGAMWAQLRAALQNSGISQQDIAARFVSVQPAIDTGRDVLDTFYDGLFSKVVPDDEMDLSGFEEPTTVDQTDLSISG